MAAGRLGPLLLLLLAAAACQGYDDSGTCEPIQLSLCKDLGYNRTRLPPNTDIQDAERQTLSFSSLIQYKCSSRLNFFLCAVYAPMCTEKVNVLIGPCRTLCESVKDRCHPIMSKLGFDWPEALNCSQFPVENKGSNMCMEGPPETAPHRLPVPHQLPVPRYSVPHHGLRPSYHGPPRALPASPCQHFVRPNFYYYVNRTGRCARACNADVAFSQEHKQFADKWVAFLAIPCLASTLFTVVTFLLDSAHFRYPERAIVFLSLCYSLTSAGHVLRLAAGRQAVSCEIEPQYNVPVLIQQGLGNAHCVIMFVLLYYFGTASSLWWVMLTVTWFLAAGLRWSHERIQQKSTYFHLLAWGLPALKTAAILVLQAVDADELTGSCYVGNQDLQTLLGFVLIPAFVYLVAGISFLLAGFRAIFRERGQAVRSRSVERLEMLTMRIGIFGVIYTVPATCVLAALLYEYTSREQWLTQLDVHPNVEILMLKIFMTLIVGIIGGLWMASLQPCQVWRRSLQRFQKRPVPPYLERVPTSCPHHHHSGSLEPATRPARHHSRRPRDAWRPGGETQV
ncbi:frizzled-4-like [Amphibalanus amphitrite]|uniref:frizzled-4-like n=1 Tax=Amphibalanus amphitrite TaxID=1232801 RepID=UPI001C917E7A|nr:frizzled-4-like [Amphibalanus amphitrite]